MRESYSKEEGKKRIERGKIYRERDRRVNEGEWTRGRNGGSVERKWERPCIYPRDVAVNEPLPG